MFLVEKFNFNSGSDLRDPHLSNFSLNLTKVSDREQRDLKAAASKEVLKNNSDFVVPGVAHLCI